jgi:hypothetical protein
MCATAGGRRRDDVRLALQVGLDVCFIPLRNAYSEWCARASWCQIVLGRREFLAVRQQRKITAEAQRTQRKARALTQRTPRKAENTEKDNGKPTATALQSQHCAPADTFQLAV